MAAEEVGLVTLQVVRFGGSWVGGPRPHSSHHRVRISSSSGPAG